MSITIKGKQHLGAAIGTPKVITGYVNCTLFEWVSEVEHPSSIAVTQPHAAYAALSYGMKHKWTYLLENIPSIKNILKQLEDVI